MPQAYSAMPLDGKVPNAFLTPPVIETVSGFSAGITSTLAVHPFDVLKTRLQLDQIHRSQLGNSFRTLRHIIHDEGSYRALYRGLAPNLIGNSVAWAMYFMWYRHLKDAIQSWRGRSERLSSLDYFLASGTSGVLTAICTNPIWVIKTRMLSTGRNTPGAYRNLAHGIVSILRTDGLLGFYRGLIPSLFGVSQGAVQFMAYEKLKHRRGGQIGGKSNLSNWDYIGLSALSKVFSGTVTYPYQVVRARLQSYHAERMYGSARDVVKGILAREGFGGFYKGLAPNIARVLPSTCVTFLVYENTKFYLPKLYDTEMTYEVD